MKNEFAPENLEVEIKKPELLFVRPELLIHSTIPEALHSVNPRTIMKSKWNTVRREAYAKNNYHCWSCGCYAPFSIIDNKFESKDNCLHAHEHYEFDYLRCKIELKEVVALCPLCHSYIHIQRSQSLFDKGINDLQDMYEIFTQGHRVLHLDKDSWNKWHLEYNNKQYYSAFKDRKEWEEHYEVA